MRKQVRKMKKIPVIIISIFIIFGQLSLYANGDPTANFSITNLKNIPKHEKYVFTAIGEETKMKFTAIIEYEYVKEASNGAHWKIHGNMPLEAIDINENYVIMASNLLITHFKRIQEFERGTFEMIGNFYNMDIETNEPHLFLISTIQGLMYIIRTFPFHSDVNDLYVMTAQQQSGRMKFKIRNKGLTTVEVVNMGEVEVWELEVRLDIPFIGAFIPKLYFLYLNDDSKTLVAMRGNLGMMNRNMNFDLIEYSREDFEE